MTAHPTDPAALRAKKMPTEHKAVEMLSDAYQRLRELGWREAMYAPMTDLEMIEAGSSGIHVGYRDDIGFWIHDGGETWPSHPVLYRERAASVPPHERPAP
jgi:hypothetical protein